MERRERHLASHVFNIVVFAAGAVGLVVMMRRLGVDNIHEVLAGVGWRFALILGLDVAGLCCDAAAIHAFMIPEARMVSYPRVLAAQVSGRTINILTPGGALGEPTKVAMLVSHAPRNRVVSSIVLFNLASFYLSVAIVLIGVPISALALDLPHHLRVVVWTSIGVLVPLVVGIGVLIHRGALNTVLDAAVRIRILNAERASAWKAQLADVDRHVRELHKGRTAGTRLGLALIVLSRIIGWGATMTVLASVGVVLRPGLLVGVFSVGVLIGWISSIVPLGLGVADGSNAAMFRIMGATPESGLLVTLVNRVRSLTIALLGLIVMVIAHTLNRISIARRRKLAAQLMAGHAAAREGHS